MPAEVEEHRQVVLGSIGHALVVIVEFLELASIEVEILSIKRRCESTDGFERSTPETGKKINGERE